MPADTTPAWVGIVADSQLKDQRILFPDAGQAAIQARGPVRRCLRQQGVAAHPPRHQVQLFDTRRPAAEGRPWASRAQAASWPALRSS